LAQSRAGHGSAPAGAQGNSRSRVALTEGAGRGEGDAEAAGAVVGVDPERRSGMPDAHAEGLPKLHGRWMQLGPVPVDGGAEQRLALAGRLEHVPAVHGPILADPTAGRRPDRGRS
jgi:hypothetical protein